MSFRLQPRRILFFSLSYILLTVFAFSQKPGGTGGGSKPSSTGGQWDSAAHSNEFGAVIKPTTAEDEGKIKFRSETTLIQVPVVVTGKSGDHVHGLDKDDFTVFENGKQQRIATFEELVASKSKIPPPPSIPGEYRNLAISVTEPRPVTVIAIDTVNTPFLDQAIGRHQLLRYLADNIDTNQVLALMIMTSDGVHVVQGLSGDSDQLAQVLKRVSGGLPQNQGISIDNQANASAGTIPVIPQLTPKSSISASLLVVQALLDYSDTKAAEFQQTRAIEMTMNSFLGIAWSLSGVPGRKSIIWLTSGFPFVLSAPDVVPGDLAPLYERTMKAFADGQISVYPVDVRGIATRGEGEAKPTAVTLPSAAPTQDQVNNRTWLLSNTYQSLNEFADMTGGKAFYNRNDLAGSFKRAADDSSSYYLVGYYLDTKNNHAGWRQLKVDIDRKDVEVRAREGFFVTRATVDPDATRANDLRAALASPIEGTGVPLTLTWNGISGEGGKKKAAFHIQIPPDGVTIEGGEPAHVNFDIAIAAYRDNSQDSKPAITTGQSVSNPVSSQQLAVIRAKGITFSKDFEVGPGQYTVRVVIRDSATGNVGSVTVPLTVN